ncbi:MAG: hypothetical protein WC465_00360 [Patescibacteria group bacterium]
MKKNGWFKACFPLIVMLLLASIVLLMLGCSHETQQTTAQTQIARVDSIIKAAKDERPPAKFRILDRSEAEKKFDPRLIKAFNRLATQEFAAWELIEGLPFSMTSGTYIVGQDSLRTMYYWLVDTVMDYNAQVGTFQGLAFLTPEEWHSAYELMWELRLPRPSSRCFTPTSYVQVGAHNELEHFGNVLFFTGERLYQELFNINNALINAKTHADSLSAAPDSLKPELVQRYDLIKDGTTVYKVLENHPDKKCILVHRVSDKETRLIYYEDFRRGARLLAKGSPDWVEAVCRIF